VPEGTELFNFSSFKWKDKANSGLGKFYQIAAIFPMLSLLLARSEVKSYSHEGVRIKTPSERALFTSCNFILFLAGVGFDDRNLYTHITYMPCLADYIAVVKLNAGI
jgi:hypothetical protein